MTPKTHASRRSALIGGTASVILGQTSVFLAPAVMMAEVSNWGLSETHAAALQSAELFTNSIICLLCARFVDRWSWRAMYLWGGSGVVLGSLFSAFAHGVGTLVLMRLLVASAGGVCSAVGAAMLGTSPEPQRSANQSFALVSMAFALLLAALPWVGAHWGPAAQFQTIAAVCAVLVLSRGPAMQKQCDPPRARLSGKPLRGGWPVFYYFCTVVLLWIIQGGGYSLSEQAGMRIGLSEHTVGAVLAGVNVMGMLACAAAGMIDGWLGRTRPLLIGTLLMGIAGAASIMTSIPWVFTLSMFLFGATNLLVTTYTLGLAAWMDPSGRLPAAFMGFISLPYSFGPLIYAWLVSYGGTALLGTFILALTLPALAIQLALTRHAYRSTISDPIPRVGLNSTSNNA